MLAYSLMIVVLLEIVAAFTHLLVVWILSNRLWVLWVATNVCFKCYDLCSKVFLHHQPSPNLVVVLV